jgi:class I fructose-bisphosphate aldolase
VTTTIADILSHYESDSPVTKANIMRILMQGRLANTGRLIIYPVDQGFEHGPARSFAINPDAYDPHYHFSLAIEAGLSAFAAPLGMLEAGAKTFAGKIPTILKMNSASSLTRLTDLAVTACVDDAVRLGCSAIGFTIYPGSDATYQQFEEIACLAADAKCKGLAVIIWSYPRGNMTKEGETALDVVGYAAHLACLLGAHIVKVKLPSAHLEFKEAKDEYLAHAIPLVTLEDRVRHIRDCCFKGRRLVVFSGGTQKSADEVLTETQAIHTAGGNGSIIGRNVFRRPRREALALLDGLIRIYLTPL